MREWFGFGVWWFVTGLLALRYGPFAFELVDGFGE